MKIILTSGGTGGHFYPIIAVARSLRKIAEEEKIVSLELTFIADKPFDEHLLAFEEIKFKKISSGKLRGYFSLLNIIDIPKTIIATLKALWYIYWNIPDVIFGKGGYASFPVLFAAKTYNVPILIHESDTVPGKVNRWAGKYAKKIAISFPEASAFFPEGKTALTGNPVRTQILGGNKEEALSLFHLLSDVPVIFIILGSQGAERINNLILPILKELVEEVQVIHQSGESNFQEMSDQAAIILEKSPYKSRYRLIPFLDEDQLRNASRISSVVVSRAGAGAIFEIAAWGLPSILIPLPAPIAAQDHQRKNAYAYAREGACTVIEESNLTPQVLLAEIRRLLHNREKTEAMSRAAETFARLDAADIIAREIIDLGLHKGG